MKKFQEERMFAVAQFQGILASGRTCLVFVEILFWF